MNVRTADLIGATTALALVVFCFHQTALIDLSFSSELETFTGPRAYPRIILGGMSVLIALQFAKIWIDRNKQTAAENAPSLHPRLTKVLTALLVLFLFAALFEPLGYIVTIVPLLIAFGFLNGAGSPIRIAAFSVIAGAVCLIAFRYGLNTVLPEGLIGIDQVF